MGCKMAKEYNFNIKEVVAGSDDKQLLSYEERLLALRADGKAKITLLKEEIGAIKRDKMLSKEEKSSKIVACQKGIENAKAVEAKNAEEVKSLSAEAVAYSNALYKKYEERIVAEENARIEKAKADYAKTVEKIKADTAARISKIQSSGSDAKLIKEDVAIANFEAKSALHDAKGRRTDSITASKAMKNQIFVAHVQLNMTLSGGASSFSEDMALRRKNYAANFTFQKFLLANGLYIAVIIFFIVCIIIAPLKVGSNLFSLPNILTIFEQSSTRMFYALGVAGLILLAGTDLSVGRMVAMGAVITGLILHPGRNIVTFFGMGPWDFSAIPMGIRVVMSLLLSIIFCVAFSSFAGFFTAKLKIHPFITTLSTQLIIYGLLFFGTSGTPVGSITSSIKDAIGGRWILGVMNGQLITFPKLIIPAVIAIIVAWFIWNKTTFGKNMYAVGGNAEAAAVSGISVFWVTLGVFIMAGIFYGCGSFLEAFRANASAGTGQGYETDAIAACVVGGISFNGGIGKIGGAVLGVLIFQGMTYALTYLGIDTTLQFVFKGVIIIAAVALDSVKYLKKK